MWNQAAEIGHSRRGRGSRGRPREEQPGQRTWSDHDPCSRALDGLSRAQCVVTATERMLHQAQEAEDLDEDVS